MTASEPTEPDPYWDPELNEPADYDGYIAYLLGEIPGIDGRTYHDGHAEEAGD